MAEQATPHGVGAVLLRRWWLLVLGVLLGALLGVLALRVLPPTYSATATLLIKGVPGTGAGANLQAAQYAVSRAKSYPSFISSNVVLEGVQSDLGDGASDAELREELSAQNPTDTPLVVVTALGGTGEQAQARADSASRHLARFITQIETVSGVSPVIVEIAVPADLPGQPSDPRPPLVLGVALAAGLAVGSVSALLFDALVRRRSHGAGRDIRNP